MKNRRIMPDVPTFELRPTDRNRVSSTDRSSAVLLRIPVLPLPQQVFCSVIRLLNCSHRILRQITVRKSTDSSDENMKRVSLHPVRAAALPVQKHGMRLTLMYRSENRPCF